MKLLSDDKIVIHPFARAFDKISSKITRITGSAASFFTALGIVIVWLATGPLFNYSNTWQLFINTGTTVVTFLMVFVIQQSQNKDTMAMQLKLNELIACNEKASNNLIDAEHFTDQELQVLKKFYIHLSTMAEKNNDVYSTHSLNEAERNDEEKIAYKSKRRAVVPDTTGK